MLPLTLRGHDLSQNSAQGATGRMCGVTDPIAGILAPSGRRMTVQRLPQPILCQRKGFMDGALHASAHDRAASHHMDGVSDRRGSESMTRCDHRSILFPCVFLRVVGFVLAKDAVRALSPDDEH